MTLRIYNTLSREKELFDPVRPARVGIYLCGPTVYKPPHIGHMVGPVIFDAIKRYLSYKGFEVNWVVNITDVEDKLIEAAAAQSTTVQALAERHTRDYLACLERLGINNVDYFPKASEHIAEIIDLCTRLIESKHAYAAEGNVYFDVTSDADYGRLSHRKVEEQESGTRALEGAGKRTPADFALWKASRPGEPAWDSPWGRGRPGWHIECSAMSMKYLGETFDIHGGGMDLMFPHHENELAQSECATGKPFARYWLHNGLTRIRTKLASGEWANEKMSGSLGNVISAAELLEKHGPELIRYLLLSTHYRRPIEFTDAVLTSSRKGLSVFHRLFERLERLLDQPISEGTEEMEQVAGPLLDSEHAYFVRAVLQLKMRFLEVMDDDFNTAGAIAVLHELAGEINGFIHRNDIERSLQPELAAPAAAAARTLKVLGGILGLFQGEFAIPPEQEDRLGGELMDLLIRLRQQARQEKNFPLADRIRDELAGLGITLEDRPDRTIWRREQP